MEDTTNFIQQTQLRQQCKERHVLCALTPVCLGSSLWGLSTHRSVQGVALPSPDRHFWYLVAI